MSLTELRPGDLAELAAGGVLAGRGPLLRLIGRNGVPIALAGAIFPRRTLWRCSWWGVQGAVVREAWFAADALQLVKRP